MVLLLMSAATITVKKSIFGHALIPQKVEAVADSTASVTYNPDGSAVIHTESPEVKGTINGYGGPVYFDIYVDKDGSITKIVPLENSETPSFFERTLPLLQNWIGQTVQQGMDLKPDAVTGATYSSQAIVQNVDAGLAYYQGAVASKNVATPWKIWVALIVTLAACILPLFVKNKLYHTLQMIANIVVLGFW